MKLTIRKLNFKNLKIYNIFYIYDEVSKLYYKDPTWTIRKYQATRYLFSEAERKKNELIELQEKFMNMYKQF